MKHLFCRNRVQNFQKWKTIFDSHLAAQHDSGLILTGLWQADEDPNNVFFLFEVTNESQARAFLGSPEAAEAGENSGVIDGEFHFLNSPPEATP